MVISTSKHFPKCIVYAVLIFMGQLSAQLTVEFRINGIASDIGDMDGWGSNYDPQWNYD